MKILLVILSLLVLTGCKKEEVKEVIPEQPKKTIKELVNIKEVGLSDKNYIILVTNNNDIQVDLTMNYSFFFKSDDIIFEKYKEIEHIKPNTNILIDIGLPQKPENFYVTYEVTESNEESLGFKRIEYNSNKYLNEISVRLVNRNITQKQATLYVILYNKGKIVDYITERIVLFPFELEPIKITPNTNINYDDYDIFIK